MKLFYDNEVIKSIYNIKGRILPHKQPHNKQF